MLKLFRSPGYVNSFFNACADSKFPRSGEDACSRNPKANKARGGPKSYQPLSLLSVPDKILERLICACVESLIDPLLPKGQAGF